MFSEGVKFVHNINELIYIFPEEKYVEVLRSAESRPKRYNAGAGTDRLVMYFDRKTYNSGGKHL